MHLQVLPPQLQLSRKQCDSAGSAGQILALGAPFFACCAKTSRSRDARLTQADSPTQLTGSLRYRLVATVVWRSDYRHVLV